ncbi:MAG TPA: [Fe-Fe] hydrogenase large subunit C-terminal domain-containing protein [Bacteroidales bacterium]|jgi:iron only hydrogenase large subunit-like protein|nr:[Fe-Fe] hydrogenase large subunit C-terminal domain-containing protein [Bacteroidales bacterium]
MGFHHALKIHDDLCIGCTHCIKSCPTEALRVKDGKAFLIAERCVDCGECMRVCPLNAISVEEDDFSRIFKYENRVALVPSVFIGQYPRNIATRKIYSGILEEGFTHVIEVEHGAGILIHLINKYLESTPSVRPVISSFCPAIVRLIQVRFPSLVSHILPYKAPLDLTAIFFRRKLQDQGIDPDKTGVFYITPCAAKIAAVKSPVGEETSPITGVINLNTLYSKVYSLIKREEKGYCIIPEKEQLLPEEMAWTLTGGEARHINGRCLAVDGIFNVIEFLEKLENDTLGHFDYLEMRACDEGCAGGILSAANRFLVSERLHSRVEQYYTDKKNGRIHDNKSILQYRHYVIENSSIDSVEPRSIMKLDDDMVQAMKKMEKIRKIKSFLPGIDCGACGSPTCRTLAEDVVQHRAHTSDCVFVTMKVKGGDGMKQAVEHSEEIWGKNRFKNMLPD